MSVQRGGWVELCQSNKKEHVHERSLQLRSLQHCLCNDKHGLKVKILHVVAE